AAGEPRGREADVACPRLDQELGALGGDREAPRDEERTADAAGGEAQGDLARLVVLDDEAPRLEKRLAVVARRKRRGRLRAVDRREHEVPAAEEVILVGPLGEVDARRVVNGTEPALPAPEQLVVGALVDEVEECAAAVDEHVRPEVRTLEQHGSMAEDA